MHTLGKCIAYFKQDKRMVTRVLVIFNDCILLLFKISIALPYKILFFLILSNLCISQSLPFDFEGDIFTADFVDFDGGVAEVVPNPLPSGINTSATVGKIVRDGGVIWSGSKVELADNLDFATNNSLTMKVYTTAPVGTLVKFKLEGSGNATERDVATTVSGEWEEMTWDFTGTPSDLNTLVFMFDFGNVGDGTETSTFYFDDINQLFGGFQIDLPVTFEATDVNYTLTDFGGNVSTVVLDNNNPSDHVVEVIKTAEAATWAGTTIGTNGGFATDIPLTLDNSIMSVRVWSPEAGTPIRLKVEDSNDPTHTCETETVTTVGGEWEDLAFDFSNEAPGTAALAFGLTNGWSYNMASIFFDFGTEGQTVGEQTYYFDDVYFGELLSSTTDLEVSDILIYPNPTHDQWIIKSNHTIITHVNVRDIQGREVITKDPKATTVTLDTYSIVPGIYIARVTTLAGVISVPLVKE